MKKSTIFRILSVILLFSLANFSFSQSCGAHESLEEHITQEVKAGRLTPEEGRKRLGATNNRLHNRSDEVTVFVVFDLATTTSALSLAAAQTFLENCSASTNGCKITYRQVNITRTDFQFTTSTNAPTMIDDLRRVADNQGWLTQADVVVGITSLNIANFSGFAEIGFCTPSNNGRVIVIEAGTTQALYAHELGHTIGLQHDDMDPTFATPSTSLMNPFVPFTPATMSQSNKNCYRTGAACSATLPIELLSLRGIFKENKNNLTWTTASEKNNKGFQIERSFDATNWLSIGYVKGTGNSDTQVSYNYQDASPLSLSYYRLRQEDFDGTKTFSNIINIKSDSKTKVILAPNPVSDNLVISFESETYAEEVSVYDVLGRLVIQFKKPTNRLEVDMQQAQAGMYIVEINVDGKRIREKILKVNE